MGVTPTDIDPIKTEPLDEDNHVPSLINSITSDEINNFQPAYKRYYEEKFNTITNQSNLTLDTCIRVHSNKICVLYLSEKHTLVQKGLKIKSINFQINCKINRLSNTMSGKGKRGAQILQPDSIICIVKDENDETYPIYSGIYGKLLEINSSIVNHPNLMIEDYYSKGYIAVILCDLKKFDECMKRLKNADDYKRQI